MVLVHPIASKLVTFCTLAFAILIMQSPGKGEEFVAVEQYAVVSIEEDRIVPISLGNDLKSQDRSLEDIKETYPQDFRSTFSVKRADTLEYADCVTRYTNSRSRDYVLLGRALLLAF